MINDQNFDWNFGRFESQAELLLHGGKERWNQTPRLKSQVSRSIVPPDGIFHLTFKWSARILNQRA